MSPISTSKDSEQHADGAVATIRGVLSEDQQDCLQEVVNVAVGQAADALARWLQVFVRFSVPRMRVVAASELQAQVASLQAERDDIPLGVQQHFYQLSEPVTDTRLQGSLAMLLSSAPLQSFLQSVMSASGDTGMSLEEFLLDLGTVINGNSLNRLALQLDTELGFSPPERFSIQQLTDSRPEAPGRPAKQWEQALWVEVNFSVAEQEWRCHLMLLLPRQVLAELRVLLDRVLADLT